MIYAAAIMIPAVLAHQWIAAALFAVFNVVVFVPRWRSADSPNLAMGAMCVLSVLGIAALLVFDRGDISAVDALLFVCIFLVAPLGGVLLYIRWSHRRGRGDAMLREKRGLTTFLMSLVFFAAMIMVFGDLMGPVETPIALAGAILAGRVVSKRLVRDVDSSAQT